MKYKTYLPHLLLLTLLGLSLQTFAQSRGLPDFTRLVEQNAPSVVNISTTQSIHRKLRQFNMPELQNIPKDSPFGELLRRFFGQHGYQTPYDDEIKKQSLGSGFIISSDGYILTNNHVVDDADEIIVRTNDRNEYKAKVIGVDQRSDIALIKIDAEHLPVVKIGSAENLKVGEWVLAIGSPFGFDHSVTAGIVSAKGRNLPSENYVPFIQTDVAINPGNSGGPLFNLDGKVVGINSQIYSRSGGFMGLSFAIPIDVAMDVAKQLKSKGRVSRGWLGVLIQDVTHELAESFHLDRPRGALVARVLPNSPASKAGLQVGDVILAYNGVELRNSAALPPLVGRSRLDRPAKLRILRGGRQIDVAVKIGELPADDEIAAATNKPQISANRLGLMVSDLPGEQRERMGLPPEGGVMVDSVMGAAAREAGIQQGDVIMMINNTSIKNVSQFNKLIKSLPAGETVAVLVHRNTGPIFLALRVPEG